MTKKIYEMEKVVKYKEVQVNNLDDDLVNQQHGNQANETYVLYNKVKDMWDFKTSQLKRYDERVEYLDTKSEDLGYRIDEVKDKLSELVKVA